jgi:protein gp37
MASARKPHLKPTDIEWTDTTLNVITGCKHGCSYCYARKAAEDGPYLRGRFGYDAEHPFAPTFHPDRLAEPEGTKRPKLVFVSSMGDALGEWVPADWIQQVIDACRRSPQHRFLWLTKNPKRYREFEWPANCWRGTSVTGAPLAEEADRLAVLAEVRTRRPVGQTFVSLEPFRETQTMALLRVTDANPAWLIIGAQTQPDRLPSAPALLHVIKGARALDVPIFLKDSLRPVWSSLEGLLGKAICSDPLPREFPAGLRLEHGKSKVLA